MIHCSLQVDASSVGYIEGQEGLVDHRGLLAECRHRPPAHYRDAASLHQPVPAGCYLTGDFNAQRSYFSL